MNKYAVYDKTTKLVSKFITVADLDTGALQAGESDGLLEVDVDITLSPDSVYSVSNNVLVESAIPITLVSIVDKYTQAVRYYINRAAIVNGYDNIDTACSYAAYTNPYQDESKRFIHFRGAVWSEAILLFNNYETTFPVVDELNVFLAKLPVYNADLPV